MKQIEKTYADFFSGIGLVDLALRKNKWSHKLSVDYNPLKFKVYKQNFPESDSKNYIVRDILNISGNEIPNVLLAHASFPCTDVSVAGSRVGIQEGQESSAIDSFIRLLYEMMDRRPPLVMLENVKGLITSNSGNDLRYLLQHLNNLGYLVDLFCVDAKHFVPQSRERVFIIGQRNGFFRSRPTTRRQIEKKKIDSFRDQQVLVFIKANYQLKWVLRDLPDLPKIKSNLPYFIDKKNNSWWDLERTNYLLNQMFQRHLNWINEKRNSNRYFYATVFRRMRTRDGSKQSTAELRTDSIAGALRTPKGGSAKQILLRVGRGSVNARHLSPKECSSLMGAKGYKISKDVSENDALFCFGDAVVVDVVKWIDENYLTPLITKSFLATKTVTKGGRTLISKSRLPESIEKKAEILFKSWCDDHIEKSYNLPIKGRLYGALIVLSNIEDGNWIFSELNQAVSTDKGKFFGERSIKNHTNQRVSLVLSKHGFEALSPTSGSRGELGRTSTGTKTAGLQMIRLIDECLTGTEKERTEEIGNALIGFIYKKIFDLLTTYHNLEGIKVKFSSYETLSSFISNLIDAHKSNPGAVIQHLVGAKFELRFDNQVNINHNKSASADKQTGRLGDFEIGSTVFHVTKTPTDDHYRKALLNAENGRKTYLLVPDKVLKGTKEFVDDRYGRDKLNRINIFSIEQFITQNIDEMATFDKNNSLSKLKELLNKYNELITRFENDNSLKIEIPDFGR